ncbi:MAG: hypothetical protein J5I41_02365 [Saprospiraceae bacterium]|nr:hypothetical protein [Saprospiraceae bacterium]
MRKWMPLLILVFAIVITTGISNEIWAQCPMCKMSAESNMRAGGSAGKGLNAGILYMLAMPYLLVGTIAWLWWKNKRSAGEQEKE